MVSDIGTGRRAVGELIPASELPAPRLELRWRKVGETWMHRRCDYRIVIPLRENDIRRERRCKKTDRWIKVRSTHAARIGYTNCTGPDVSPLNRSLSMIDTPYRDGAHALWDSLALGGIPVYAICEGLAMLVEQPKDGK